MDISNGIADLHMHTISSDGTCTIADRIQQAKRRGLGAISITDHDCLSKNIEYRTTCRNGVELIAGVEVRADVRNTKVELLGYFVDPSDDRLDSTLEEVRGYRRERNQQIISRLHDITSLDRSYNDIRAEADGLLGRPHIANVLIEDGIVDSVSAAFDEYLANDDTAFVPMTRVLASEVIDVIQGAGGVVSLAHPGRIRTDTFEPLVEELVADGLDAIEVQYPYADAPTGDYAEVSAEDAATLSTKKGLLQTGGSDCHGPDSGKFRIGDVRISQDQLDALREHANQRLPL